MRAPAAPPSILPTTAAPRISSSAPRPAPVNAFGVVLSPASAKNIGISTSDGDVLDALDQRVEQAVVARQARAEQERAEHRDAGRSHSVSRGASRRRRSAALPAPSPPARPSARVTREQPRDERAQRAEHDASNRDESDQRAHEVRSSRCAQPHQRHDQRQHDPREHIGNRRGSQRELADRVRVMPRSLRMRAMTGNAVIDIDAAMNSANGQNATPAGAKRGCSAGAIASPSAIGNSTPSTPTHPAAMTAFARAAGRAQFRADDEHEEHEPDLAQAFAARRAFRAETASVWTSGASAPNTIGPSRMPAIISPITGGWPSRAATARARARPRG